MPTRNVPLPEYLQVFGTDGPVTVDVKFASGQRSIPERHIHAEDVEWLVSTDGQQFLQQLNFDDWPMTVQRYEIDPIAQRLTIHVNDTHVAVE